MTKMMMKMIISQPPLARKDVSSLGLTKMFHRSRPRGTAAFAGDDRDYDTFARERGVAKYYLMVATPPYYWNRC